MKIGLLLLACLPAGDPPEIKVERLHELSSGRSGDEYGAALAVGEIDGDAIIDFAVGAPGDEEVGPEAGAVYVYSGRKLELLHVLRPAEPGGRFGEALAFSDVDRDGQADVIVGAPAADAGAGAVYACVKLRKDRPPKPVLVLQGKRPGDRAGSSVSAAPARPGMELEGVLVGVPGHDEAGRDDAGRAVVLRFKGDKLKAEVVHEWAGATLGAGLGTFVDFAGDEDDDGTWDLLVGEPGAEDGEHGVTGALRVLDGADGSLQRRYTGAAEGDRFGAAASFVRVHGDGVQYHEILVGAPGGGYARVLGAREGQERASLSGRPGEKGFGALVTRSARLGSGYLYGFAVATVADARAAPEAVPGLRIVSGESLEVVVEVPFADLRAVVVASPLDAEISDEFLVGEVRPEGGVVHVLRILPED